MSKQAERRRELDEAGARDHLSAMREMFRHSGHDVVPVETTFELVAYLCMTCDEQLAMDGPYAIPHSAALECQRRRNVPDTSGH